MSTAPFAPLEFPRKDKDAKITYALDWTDWLNEDDTIDSFVVTVTGADNLGNTQEGNETRVVVGGGTAGTIVTVHFHVVSTLGLEDDRTVYLEILER